MWGIPFPQKEIISINAKFVLFKYYCKIASKRCDLPMKYKYRM